MATITYITTHTGYWWCWRYCVGRQ